MKSKDVLVKWTGSKRLQAPNIIKHFPKSIKTYYEPFLGGGSMLYVLMNSDIKVEKFECSDLNKDLIEVWKTVKENPKSIIDFYKSNWPHVSREIYDKIRQEHNETPDPRKLFFLLRTCRNGLVRYNKHQKFNSAFHHGRKGINPDQLEKTVIDWHEKLVKHNVNFTVRDYKNVKSNIGDLVYLDPPYARSIDFRMYFLGAFDFDSFWNWIKEQHGSYLVSLNGYKDDIDCRVDFPTDLYDFHELVANGLNKFDQMQHNHVVAQDSLYVRIREES